MKQRLFAAILLIITAFSLVSCARNNRTGRNVKKGASSSFSSYVYSSTNQSQTTIEDISSFNSSEAYSPPTP